MDISVIVPLYNEAESLPELYAWIQRVMNENKFTYEVLFVNDGSTDNSWKVIQDLKAKSENVRAIRFRRNYGKSPALFCGFERAEGEVVITMDADLQDSPDEIPELYRMIMEDGYDLVSGWKQKRYDNTFTKNIPSKIYNATARKVTGLKLHDMNCGLKAYRKEVIKNIEVYGVSVTSGAGTPFDKAINFIAPTATTATKPIKNITLPHKPKKCIGCLPNLSRK